MFQYLNPPTGWQTDVRDFEGKEGLLFAAWTICPGTKKTTKFKSLKDTKSLIASYESMPPIEDVIATLIFGGEKLKKYVAKAQSII